MILLGLLTILCTNAAEDYYTDDNGATYSIGLFGERIYESDDGKPNKKVLTKERFDNQDDFTSFGWMLFQVGVFCTNFTFGISKKSFETASRTKLIE